MKMISAGKAAVKLGTTRYHVVRLYNEGKLRGEFDAMGRLRFSEDDVERVVGLENQIKKMIEGAMKKMMTEPKEKK